MRILLVSNRAPVNLVKEGAAWRYEKSSGGLASGLSAYAERRAAKGQSVRWIGWPGTTVDDEAKVGKEMERRYQVRSVFLSAETMENFYEGFCNKTLWPLFHYFPGLAEYSPASWENYIAVNRRFADAVREEYRNGDVIWIHDYHLLLLPEKIREQ